MSILYRCVQQFLRGQDFFFSYLSLRLAGLGLVTFLIVTGCFSVISWFSVILYSKTGIEKDVKDMCEQTKVCKHLQNTL